MSEKRTVHYIQVGPWKFPVILDSSMQPDTIEFRTPEQTVRITDINRLTSTPPDPR